MNRKLLATVILPACIALPVVALVVGAGAYGKSTCGDIRGVTRNSGGLPLPDVQVVLHSVEENWDRTVVSGSDGAFIAENLMPGHYQLTAKKEGVGSSAAATVELMAHQSLRVDMSLASPNGSMRASDPVLPAAPTSPNRGSMDIGTPNASTTVATGSHAQPATEDLGNAPLTKRERELLDRIDRLEQRLAALEAKDASQTSAGVKTTPGTEPTVASLSPAAALPPAKVLAPTPPQGQAPETAQQQQPGGRASTPQPAQAAAPPTHTLPEALEAPAATPGVDNFTPFAYGDFTWLNGNPRNKDTVLDTKFFTPEVRFDTHFMEDFNQPKDHSMGGSTESFRSGEVQLEQISVGGDFHWQNVRGRILTMNGLFATTTPRNDASAGVGQWDVRGAYKYVSEAYGGYHFNVNHGLNVDAGIFVSYIGLFSYYNFDNWVYQPSFVSSNTPWFFNGVRIQWFPTNKLKIEPWIINGWQSYNKYNGHMGFGGQILYRPKEWLSLVFNNYGNGEDTLGNPKRTRLHTDDSIEVRYYNHPESTGITKMAFSLTGDLGCEYGGGVSCTGNHAGGPKQAFLGWMAYNRFWFKKDKYALTVGGGRMNNPGRYLTLLPPINGADAVSGSPYFTANPGDQAHMWDGSLGLQWMPKQYITWWVETVYRHSDVPYWTGRGGITPPGGNNGSPAQFACITGAPSGQTVLGLAEAACGGGPSSVWFPDLRKGQATLSLGVMVKF